MYFFEIKNKKFSSDQRGNDYRRQRRDSTRFEKGQVEEIVSHPGGKKTRKLNQIRFP